VRNGAENALKHALFAEKIGKTEIRNLHRSACFENGGF
jgi:hypothetical protein